MADPDTNSTADFWRDVYDACRLEDIPEAPCFETFVENPWHHLQSVGQSDAALSMARGFRPLLPAQAAIALRLRIDELADDLRLKAGPEERASQSGEDAGRTVVLH
ncbi:hypothetical protein [Salinisphaera sp. T31B1]|uniref:hypothetical protein n=1 Tax=Salinisphaera sp. T31B1 TaxID=727963 RepID=UPI003340EC3B